MKKIEERYDVRRVAEGFGLFVLHPAVSEVISLRERVDELEKELGRPYVVERGPWEVSDDGRTIMSDDFTHDVMLAVSGDFGSDEDRKAYSDEIARRLNLYGKSEA